MTFDDVVDRIRAERERVEALRSTGALAITADDPSCPDILRLAAIVEEVGEVARCLHDGLDPSDELEQVAGVAIAWLQGIS